MCGWLAGGGGGGIVCQGDRLYVSPYDRSLGETAAGDSPGNGISSQIQQ